MNQRVLITGGAGGIGHATAAAFIERGDRVHVCDVSEENIADFRERFPTASTSICDVADPVQVDRAFAETIAALGGLDILVNNAGTSGPVASVEEITPQQWQSTLEVSLNGAFYFTRNAVPALKQAGSGAIVNISSSAGLHGCPLRTPYVAAKWAIVGLTKTLAMELGEFGIRVNAICPGSVDGPRLDRVIAAEAAARNCDESDIRQAYTKYVSMQTFIKAEDVANMILFLCSPLGDKISGQALSVDGHTETLRC